MSSTGEAASPPQAAVSRWRWGYIALGLILYVFLGLVYAWSVFVPPLELEFGWTRAQTSMVFSLCMFCFCLGGLAAGLAAKRLHPRWLFGICGILIGTGFLLASRCSTLAELYLIFGGLIGIGVGVGYTVLITGLVKWVPDRIGLAGGIMLMGFGAGGMILGAACAWAIGAFGWRRTFSGLGLFYLAFFLSALSLIRLPRPGTVFPKTAAGGRQAEGSREMGAKEMLRSRSFQVYFAWACCTSAIGLSLMGHGVTLALEIGATSAGATVMAGLIAIFNGAGRVAGGQVFDRLGRKALMCSSCSGLLAASALLMASLRLRSQPLMIAAFAIGGLMFGFSIVSHSSVINSFFGMRHYPLNFSILTLYSLLSAFGPYVAGVFRTWLGWYVALPVMIFVLAAAGLWLALILRKP